MFIQRVQIEEGFLDGLDVSLSEGLNTIIGARGTGKTSLVELIRFCLGVRGYTPETAKRSRDHALSVIGDGQVIVTLSDGQRLITVSRTAQDDAPQASGPFKPPILFSQTEIEGVGLQAISRLRLIDGFLDDGKRSYQDDDTLISEIRSLTEETHALRREAEDLDVKVLQIPTIDKSLSDLTPQEQQLGKTSQEAAAKKKALDTLLPKITHISSALSTIDRFLQTVTKRRSALAAVASGSLPLEPATGGASDPLDSVRKKFIAANTKLAQIVADLEKIEVEVRSVVAANMSEKLALEEQARILRNEVEALEAGAGAVIRQAQQLREQRAQLVSLQALAKERRKQMADAIRRRGIALDRLDNERSVRSQARASAVKLLNVAIGPRIRITLTRAGQFDNYSAAIADALKGSGLRYNDLSPALAKAISPRELLEACDSNDFDSIAESASITRDRAARVLAHLRESDIGAIATIPIEDVVTFELLDGRDYKDIAELSTGQRCTVVLPIILRHTERILIVDQPEDHIDNAFIVDTLVKAIINRDPSSQIVFTTHNANIPVLGNANRVIQLGSNGRRGYVLAAGDLEDSVVVSGISTIMEGGAEAFERRAEFYRRHGEL